MPNIMPTTASTSSGGGQLSASKLPAIKRTKSQSVAEFVSVMSTNGKMNADRQLARAFYACNFPFRAIEHKQFVRAVHMINPSYKLPDRRAVSVALTLLE